VELHAGEFAIKFLDPWRRTVKLSLTAQPRPTISRAIDLVLAAALAAVFVAAGCGGGNSTGSTSSGSSNPPGGASARTGATIYPGTARVPINSTIQFSAFLPGQAGSGFTWSVTGGGSIDSSGVYTAPASPASVTVTATSQGNAAVTGTAAITITAAQGVLVSPAAVAIAAGATQIFTASVNGQSAASVNWKVDGILGGNGVYGTIDSNGSYTAPLTPPPDGAAVITAVTGTGSAAVSGTATAAVVFSNASLSGPYAFSYKGQGSAGFLAAAGSFTAQGSAGSSGQIFGGVEDALGSGTSAAAHTQFSGTFAVTPDGRATAVLDNNVTWQFVLLSNAQGGAARKALLIRFDKSTTGSGTIEVQNPALIAASAFSGNYAFGLSGVDGSGKPLDIAGRFYADGVATIPLGSAVQDVNDNGTTTLALTAGSLGDKSLQGSFLMDSTLPGSGRGTVSLTSDNGILAASGTSVTLQFAFYMVDNTHLKLVETDNKAALAGDFYSAANTPADGSFTAASALPTGNYVFTAGGVSTNGAYASGGIFNSNGASAITGVFDINGGITDIRLNSSLAGSSYTADSNSGRVALRLFGNGATANFVGYPVAFNSPSGTVRMLELIELDKNVIASGTAVPQTATNPLQGNYALNLAGIPWPKNGAIEQDIVGQLTTIGSTSFTGTVDVNNFAQPAATPNVPLTSTTAIVGAAANGRGTVTLATNVTSLSLAYYIIDDSDALLLEVDGARAATGLVSRQF
jgi:hypothetical protein